MWKVTGDKKWRERGWDMFQALEKHTKTDIGYASLQSVENSSDVPQRHLDEQPR
jgi:mannosyl-oligosaccharide alpha-1,2-mannosidase